MRSDQGRRRKTRDTRLFFRGGRILWSILTLFIVSGALLLMFCDADWVSYFERVRPVRNFMANPLEMLGVEAFGVFSLLVGISVVMDNDGSLLDTRKEESLC
jgi:hypothetical protein